MKVVKHKTGQRKTDVQMRQLDIASYGENNEYPEKLREIFEASPTGKGCLNTAQRFIFGDGFASISLASAILNRKGQKGNQVLKKLVEDWTYYRGFALHINYNALLQIVEVQHVPFEHCRIGIKNTGEPDGKIAVYPDWTGRNKLLKKKPTKELVSYYPVYNSHPNVIYAQIGEKGIENYSGQILYHSDEGDLTYPLSAYDPVVTEMSTEEGISTVLYRNAKHNFLPAGMIVKKSQQTQTNEDDRELDSGDGDLANEINTWQGDEKAAKMILVEVGFDEEKPEFVPFPIQNFDKMFDSTAGYVQDNIGRMFMQPPILRGVDVGAGFGADLMKNAYDFYNSIVEGDRKTIESVLEPVFKSMDRQFESYTIKPLEYQKQATNEPLD